MEAFFYIRHNVTDHRVEFAFKTVGLALSSVAVCLLILTAVLFPQWRQSYKNQVLLQFMICRYFYVFLRFIFDATLIFRNPKRSSFGQYHDILWLVYTELALMCWMVVFSKNMYDNLVTVINVPKNHKLLRTSLYTWLIPVPVAILVQLVCYMRMLETIVSYLLYFMVIKWPLVLANGVVLVRIVKSLVGYDENRKPDKIRNIRIIIVMTFILFVFSFQQIVNDIHKIVYTALLRSDHVGSEIVWHILEVFSIIPLYQYPYAIGFWICGNSTTRMLWKKFLFKKFKRRNTNSSILTVSETI